MFNICSRIGGKGIILYEVLLVWGVLEPIEARKFSNSNLAGSCSYRAMSSSKI